MFIEVGGRGSGGKGEKEDKRRGRGNVDERVGLT